MILPIQKTNTSAPVQEAALFDFDTHDRWPVEALGLKPDYGQGCYYLKFNSLSISWLKTTAKKFIRLQAAIKSYSSCRSYLIALARFNAFLCTLPSIPSAEMINRQLVINYIEYLTTRNISSTTRKMSLIHLRTFHQLVIQENWLPWPEKPLVYSRDIPKGDETIPKFIPEVVIMQLKQHLHLLPNHLQNIIIVLLETGRRISEICSLPFNCLERDRDGDWLLRVKESKMKKSYLLPISTDGYQTIISQQTAVLQNSEYQNKNYLFPARMKSKSHYINVRNINRKLNELAEACRIYDDNQQLWHFHVHQFRHTVGTRMINAGVSQVIVQKYLGHESAEMTARYAHIHDKTLKSAFNEYQGRLVDVHGQERKFSDSHQEAAWLKKHIMSQALPNGLCALPIQQQRCPHANACLSCAHFRTHKKHLPQHKAQLEQTIHFIKQAQSQGLVRQAEMNESVKVNLERIICSLEVVDNA